MHRLVDDGLPGRAEVLDGDGVVELHPDLGSEAVDATIDRWQRVFRERLERGMRFVNMRER